MYEQAADELRPVEAVAVSGTEQAGAKAALPEQRVGATAIESASVALELGESLGTESAATSAHTSANPNAPVLKTRRCRYSSWRWVPSPTVKPPRTSL